MRQAQTTERCRVAGNRRRSTTGVTPLPTEALSLCTGKIRAGALRTRGTAELRSATTGQSPRVVAWIARPAAFLANEAGHQTTRTHKVPRGTTAPLDGQLTIMTLPQWP